MLLDGLARPDHSRGIGVRYQCLEQLQSRQGSRILLTGGLTPSDVLFNVTGNSGSSSIAGNSLFKGWKLLDCSISFGRLHC
jgi:hypothetical protein